jgi:hypothetical protein
MYCLTAGIRKLAASRSSKMNPGFLIARHGEAFFDTVIVNTVRELRQRERPGRIPAGSDHGVVGGAVLVGDRVTPLNERVAVRGG